MKHTLLITTALMLVVGCSNAQTYQFAETFYDNGLPKFIKTFKESKGKFELVKSISLYSNGQKRSEWTYKDGELDGQVTSWYENGQKDWEDTFKDGEFIERTYWNEDGNKR